MVCGNSLHPVCAEFVKMLVCRQDSSADQEIQEAYTLLVSAVVETERLNNRHSVDRNPVQYPTCICDVEIQHQKSGTLEKFKNIRQLFEEKNWLVREPGSGGKDSKGMQAFKDTQKWSSPDPKAEVDGTAEWSITREFTYEESYDDTDSASRSNTPGKVEMSRGPWKVKVTKTKAAAVPEDHDFDIDALIHEGTHNHPELEVLRHDVYKLISTSGCDIISRLEAENGKKQRRRYRDVRKCFEDIKEKRIASQVDEDRKANPEVATTRPFPASTHSPSASFGLDDMY